MTHTIINLSLPIVTDKVEQALAEMPSTTWQQYCSLPMFREQLTAYVLRRMPTLYTTAELPQSCSLDMPANCFSKEQQAQMDQLIDEGIHHLMERYQEQTSPFSMGSYSSDYSAEALPSSWFG